MGGSGGGGGSWSYRREQNYRNDKEALKKIDTSSFDSEANAFLQELLSDYNNRNQEVITKHLDILKQTISKDIDGVITTLFGGSVKKHTYVDGLSDVDVLLLINDSSLAEDTPNNVIAYVKDCISKRLPNTDVQSGNLAVTVNYSDGTQMQILPALRTPVGIRIANPNTNSWSNVVRPQEFAKKLSDVNQTYSGKIIPVIKLFKGLQSNLPSSNQLSGYHVESLAIEAFKNYTGRLTYKDMLAHFVKSASKLVERPILDTTGQSFHVDDYLGVAMSDSRVRVSKSLDRLANRLEAKTVSNDVDGWKDIFKE